MLGSQCLSIAIGKAGEAAEHEDIAYWPQNPFSKKGRFKVTVDNTQRMSDAQWNRKQKDQEKARQERVDLILEKIKKSGYNNLTDEEKKSLFDLSRNEQ